MKKGETEQETHEMYRPSAELHEFNMLGWPNDEHTHTSVTLPRTITICLLSQIHLVFGEVCCSC